MKKTKALNYVFHVFFEAGKGKSVCVVFAYIVISLIPSLLLILNRKIFDQLSADVFSFAVSGALIAFFCVPSDSLQSAVPDPKEADVVDRL